MIYRVVIIDNGKEVSLTCKDGEWVLEGEPSEEVRYALELAMDKLVEVKELDES